MSDYRILCGNALELAPAMPPGEAALAYLDPPFFSGRRRRNQAGGPAYDDRWPGGMVEYLSFLRGLLNAVHPLLKPNGVLALHLDWRAAHHGRLELERLFGPDAFVNEIIWSYRTGGVSRRSLGRKHDNIHVFAAGPQYTFHRLREKSYLAHRYGFQNIEIHEDEDGPYTLSAMRDVWELPALRGNQKEYAGYPTQKPLALLSRLIECFTNPGDLVVDPCCGSGTTLVAAVRLGRRGLGFDSSAEAVELACRRLSENAS
ncbi:MAG: site-specific DNA-methyltransferase [Planctomycetes bacterium]|nr:site-specific DNA-methyltransferase [Planctomycetota bacterium]MCB9935320.1 site-specific DNA-methyltransferase [Planctomycetota bacterium]